MKILLFGKDGQVGWELSRQLPQVSDVISLGRADADFSDPENLRGIVHEFEPDVIINAAAYTDVEKAEKEEDLARIINGVAPGVLAEESKRRNILLVHYSTDYVFDGFKDGSYTEDDEPNPINAYGRTKLAGEMAIQSSGCEYIIFRVSWIYAARGNNFLLRILQLVSERDVLGVVDDQIGAPTEASMIASKTISVLSDYASDSNAVSGVYHLASLGHTSWYGFSKSIIKNIQKNNVLPLPDNLVVNPVSTESFKSKARRPINSCMDTSKIEGRFDLKLPHWEESLGDFVRMNIKTLQNFN